VKHAFLDHHSSIESPIHHLDARAKIVVFFTFILVGVSSPPSSFVIFGLLAFGLMSITLLARLPLGHLIKKAVTLLPFLFFVAASIPFMKKDDVEVGFHVGLGGLSVSRSGLWIFWNVMIKAFLGLFSIILLYSTTSFPRLVRGMERLRVPKIFTVLFSFMYRYSFILVDEIQRMKRARDSRCFGGKWIWQVRTIGHMIGMLFVRSFHRGERVYLAMLSRGYEGTMPDPSFHSERLGKAEKIFLSLVPLLILLRFALG
jgi:cobalt/nickel transport system permease protein